MTNVKKTNGNDLTTQLMGMSFTGRQLQALSRSTEPKAVKVFEHLADRARAHAMAKYRGFGAGNDPKFLSLPAVASRIAKAPNKFNGGFNAVVELAYGPKLAEHVQIARFGGDVTEKSVAEAVEGGSGAPVIDDLAFLADINI